MYFLKRNSKITNLNVQKAFKMQKYSKILNKRKRRDDINKMMDEVKVFKGSKPEVEKGFFPKLEPDTVPSQDRPNGDKFQILNSIKEAKKKRQRLPFSSLKAEISEEEVERRKERLITEKRGGTVKFDGGVNEGYDSFLKRIENISPKAVYANSRVENRDSSNWLYHSPMGVLNKKPGDDFNKTIQDIDNKWRKGDYMTTEKKEQVWKQTLNTLPIFRKKPSDPFRSNPSLIDRISFKDPKILSKFLSRGGKIIASRFSGVRWKTQRRIKKEIHKARFLGLFSFSGNLSFNHPDNQPQFSTQLESEEKDALIKKMTTSKHWLKNYLTNLEKGLQVNGSEKWIPPKKRTNPKHSVQTEKLAYFGNSKMQLLEKYQELNYLNGELDSTLTPFRKLYNLYSSKNI